MTQTPESNRTAWARAASTCPRCGRTSFNPDDRENGWCAFCSDYTAPTNVHPEIVTLRVAADRARTAAGDDQDQVAAFVRAFAGVLDVCSKSNRTVGTVGHAHVHTAALAFLGSTRHLEAKKDGR